MTVSFHQAMALAYGETQKLDAETVALADAIGRITATPVHALTDHPPFDASAMDGYAIGMVDGLPASLTQGAAIYAGGLAPTLARGIVHPISTGAPVPDGCHAVVTKENARLSEGRLILDALPVAGLNIRRAGEDAAAGDIVLDAGRSIHAAALGALTSYGIARLSVRRRPRIAIISSGDELRPGAANIVHDSNGPMLRALFAATGADAWMLPPMGDDRAAIAATLDMALASNADIIVTTGGVSVGDRDFIPAWLEAAGAKALFARIPMRPGKPTRCVRLSDRRLFFALPGNPAAALVAGRFFVTGAIRAMLGLPAEEGETFVGHVPARADVTLVLKARRSVAGGEISVEILPGQQSHRLRPLLDADSWLVVDPDPTIAARLFPLGG